MVREFADVGPDRCVCWGRGGWVRVPQKVGGGQRRGWVESVQNKKAGPLVCGGGWGGGGRWLGTWPKGEASLRRSTQEVESWFWGEPPFSPGRMLLQSRSPGKE